METRLLGRSGLTVTRMGLGLAALGRPGYINLGHAADLGETYSVEAMRQHAFTVLDAAWEGGVRYFDAARSYGKAESFLWSWLQARGPRPGEVTVGSKWGYVYTADWRVDAPVHEVKEHSLKVLRQQRQESRENLGDYLKLYQIHSATLDSGVLENQAVLEELGRYRDGGLAIGLSVSGNKQAETPARALEVSIGGQALFSTVQATWNLLEPSAGPTLQAAHDRGMGVIVKEALANGRLTAKNDDPAFAEKRGILEEAAREARTTLDALALAAVLAQPWADVVLSGASTREQLGSNLAALDVAWTAELGERLSVLAEGPEEYWSERSALKWN